ncbi:MAG: hypothetical protein BWY09_01644 [Candidatus Hydrogenedentes bacterium ADurb.Bin179]|nr:MAG: hypothetical protein BWY09_01644 [Candidatus Hydrogenedentes bacterium ADurb.Bin179]
MREPGGGVTSISKTATESPSAYTGINVLESKTTNGIIATRKPETSFITLPFCMNSFACSYVLQEADHIKHVHYSTLNTIPY